MERSQLAQARIEKGMTQPAVAEYLGVDTATVCRWEKGSNQPYPRHIQQLCLLFGKSAPELGLMPIEMEEKRYPASPGVSALKESGISPVYANFFQRDIELRLQCIIFDWQHRQKSSYSYAMLQYRLSQELEVEDFMTDEQQHPQQNPNTVNLARRDALRRVALLPIHVLGLSALNKSLPWAAEEVLTHCAAGITACGYLSKGQYEDMSLAFSVLSSYLTPLKELVDQSSKHRKEAARLAAQALHIKAALGVHREGPKRAAGYGKQAEIFSKESGDILLQLIVMRRLAWIYFCDKQGKKALTAALQAQYVLEHANVPIPALIHSAVYAELAPHQAQSGHEDDASSIFQCAHEQFPDDSSADNDASDSGASSIIQFDRSDLLNGGGLTYAHLGRYDEAFNLFSQIIDPETLIPRISTSSELVRIEIINRLALISLKRSTNRDKELSLKLWTAGMQGAIALHSEQRFSEAVGAYDVMEALWPGDKQIRELRDLTRHW